MSDRLFGAVFFFVATALWIGAGGIVVGFGDQVGPVLFPRMIAVPMGLLSLYLVLKPDPDPAWPRGRMLLIQALLLLVLLAYPLLIEPLGFPLATVLAALLLGRLMGAAWMPSTVSALVIGVGLYVLFDPILGLPLPLAPALVA